MERAFQGLNRRAALAALGIAGAAPLSALAATRQAPLQTFGALKQGGFVICRTTPGAAVSVDGVVQTAAGTDGLFVAGFDRDAPAAASLSVTASGYAPAIAALAIAPVAYDVQRIDGLPPQTVTPTDPDVIARIAYEHAIKAKAFASRDDSDGFKDGFSPPLDHPIRTSPFGVQRVLNGVPKTPHYGVDLAAPIGTPIHAPAPGLVVLAEPDLFLDGGLILIDHGQGLISMYLHQSRLDVRAGDRVARRQPIGAVGMKGRATGPHLCWRMKWRDRNLDPSLMLAS